MEDLLKNMRSIAVIGASASRTRASNRMVRYLQQSGFIAIPVNPNYEVIEGISCYPSIHSIPADVQIDVFDVFRNARYAEETVQEIVDRASSSGQQPAIWTQLGVSTEAARKVAEGADLRYISNRCLMVEHSMMDTD